MMMLYCESLIVSCGEECGREILSAGGVAFDLLWVLLK
jgi:hypothetical protein